jgi:hypothetical protein
MMMMTWRKRWREMDGCDQFVVVDFEEEMLKEE